MATLSDFPKVECKSRDAVRRWLDDNHASGSTTWLVTYKKHVPDYYVAYGDIVDELLCYGWIDSRTRRVDEDRTMLLIGPRKPGGTWSASNKRRLLRLEREGRITPAGQAPIDAAKADGSWAFLDDIENLVIPDDLAAALRRNRTAAQHFEAFNDSAKKVILLWIKTAKRDKTRAQRVSETVRLAALNVKAAHPEAKGR